MDYSDDKYKNWKPDDSGDIVCPLCERKYSRIAYKIHLAFDKKHLELIKKDHPDWQEQDGCCFPCINLYRAELKLPALTREECLPFLRITK